MESSKSFNNVTCAFCGLACDDLQIKEENGQLKARDETLPEPCRSHFENSAGQSLDATAMIDGQAASTAEAVSAAVRLIEKAQRPLLGGLLLDIQGAQEAVRLAVDCGAVLDHYNSEAVLHNVKVLQHTGGIFATLSEVRVRADNILVIGDKILDSFPRLSERILAGTRPLAENANAQISFVGPCAERIPETLQKNVFERIAVPADELHACIEMLSAIAHGHRADYEHSEALSKIASSMETSQYSAVLWDADDLDSSTASLSIELLTLLLRKLNQSVRCVGVPMGGNGLTSYNVCLWQTSYPLRSAFDREPPVFDPVAHSTAELIAQKSVDLIIWSAALRKVPPPESDIPTIAITRPDTVIEHPVAVQIPVGIPGIDHSGNVFRSDGVTILPMQKLRDSALLPAAKIFADIRRQLSTKESFLC